MNLFKRKNSRGKLHNHEKEQVKEISFLPNGNINDRFPVATTSYIQNQCNVIAQCGQKNNEVAFDFLYISRDYFPIFSVTHLSNFNKNPSGYKLGGVLKQDQRYSDPKPH